MIAMFALTGTAIALLNPLNVSMALAGSRDVTVEYGEPFNDDGATAALGARHYPRHIEDLDVAVHGSVNTHKVGTYDVTYEAEWWRYTASEVRRVRVVDTQSPTLALSGEPAMVVTVGQEYVEPGYTASDNADGDLTGVVEISGSVDTGVEGTYELTYTVSDTSGNTAQALRTVTVERPVQPEIVASEVVPAGKVIYLTFDDGPTQYTVQLLDTLAAHGVKATFFVTGNGDPSLIGRMAREGHAVGVHTYTHNYRTIYSSEDAFLADINQINALIEAQTGQRSNILRFAGGSSNTVSRFNPGIMSRLTANMPGYGYTYFDWNVSSGDASAADPSTAQIIANVTGGVSQHDVSVVLQHDTNPNSVAAVDAIITWGLQNGYTFLPLDASSPGAHHPVAN